LLITEVVVRREGTEMVGGGAVFWVLYAEGTWCESRPPNLWANATTTTFQFIRLVQWRTQEFFGGGGVSTNSVEDRGQIERIWRR
jgi:hypothetical protein